MKIRVEKIAGLSDEEIKQFFEGAEIEYIEREGDDVILGVPSQHSADSIHSKQGHTVGEASILVTTIEDDEDDKAIDLVDEDDSDESPAPAEKPKAPEEPKPVEEIKAPEEPKPTEEIKAPEEPKNPNPLEAPGASGEPEVILEPVRASHEPNSLKAALEEVALPNRAKLPENDVFRLVADWQTSSLIITGILLFLTLGALF